MGAREGGEERGREREAEKKKSSAEKKKKGAKGCKGQRENVVADACKSIACCFFFLIN